MILPISSIHPEEKELFGENLVNLAKLQRDNLSVLPGIAILPPEIFLEIVRRYRAQFGNNCHDPAMIFIASELKYIPPPSELSLYLKKSNIFFINDEVVPKSKVWMTILDNWLYQFKAYLLSSINKQIFSVQTVFFVNKKFEKVLAQYDPFVDDVLLKSEGKVDKKDAEEIKQAVIVGNKKLVFPQVYFFLLDPKPRLYNILPFTQSGDMDKAKYIATKVIKTTKKSAVKVFFNGISGFEALKNLDGAIIEADRFTDEDELIKRLMLAAEAYFNKSVILKLPQGKVAGKYARVFNFVRNKKNYLNLEIAISCVPIVDDFLKIKRDLLANEISRKGSLKLWFEAGVPANIVDFSDFLDAGVDGYIINLDKIFLRLLGLNSFNEVSQFNYKNNIKTLLKFLKDFMLEAKAQNFPLILYGNLATDDEVVSFLYQYGVWAVAVEAYNQAESFPDYLNWLEKRMVLKKAYS